MPAASCLQSLHHLPASSCLQQLHHLPAASCLQPLHLLPAASCLQPLHLSPAASCLQPLHLLPAASYLRSSTPLLCCPPGTFPYPSLVSVPSIYLQYLHHLMCIASAAPAPGSPFLQHSSPCSCSLLLPSACLLQPLHPYYHPLFDCSLPLLHHCCLLLSLPWLHTPPVAPQGTHF